MLKLSNYIKLYHHQIIMNTFPVIQEVVKNIPDADKPFAVVFNDGDEYNETKAQKIWGKTCHVLTLDMVIRLPFDKPIVATWGDHLCYDGVYDNKADLLTTISFSLLKKEETNMMLVDVNILDGYRSAYSKNEEFYIYHNDSPYVRCGGSDWPIYIFY